MTEEVLNGLSEILKKHICTMSKASLDDSRKEPMTESELKVINFDKIPNEYSRGKGWEYVPCSNDALYIINEQEWYFIEFKNGSIEKDSLYRKIYDSLIILIELGVVPNFQYVRDNFNYILVYNSEKYPKIQKSEGRSENYDYILNLAKTEKRLFEIDKFEGYLFKKTHTYNKIEFSEKFIKPMEQQEKLVISS
jgi:hypothetical protein